MARYRQIRLLGAQARTPPEAAAVFLIADAHYLPAGYKALDEQVGGALSQAIERSELATDLGDGQTLYPRQGPSRLFVVGLGQSDRFDGNALRTAAGKLCHLAHAAGVTRLSADPTPAVADWLEPADAGAALADGLTLANERFDAFKGAAGANEPPTRASDLRVQVPRQLRDGFERALTVARGVETARQLAATPPNVANPAYMVEQCRALARRTGLRCSVIDAKRAAELNMEGLLAVGRAGSEPPALIVLEWPGESAGGEASAGKKKTTKKKAAASRPAAGKPLMLVGKAITFDTGGYSLKPSASMKGMKYDKCGGTAVIGAMEAIAGLNLPQRVVGLIPCAENMIDESAYRVDDILTLANGVTVEVANTDAEGRLVLADAMAWGTTQYEPAAVVDMGTLTGSIVVALGKFSAGLFCSSDDLRDRIQQAANVTGEKVWPMPLWQEHRDQMTSDHADIVNSADRKAHPIQCAAFLSYFPGSDAAARACRPCPGRISTLRGWRRRKRRDRCTPKDRPATGFG